MDHFKEYFTFIQKFDLRLAKVQDKRKSSSEGPLVGNGYDISHQNPHFSFAFKQHLRILKDLAIIDLIGAGQKERSMYLGQTSKLLAQFNQFWEQYFIHNPTGIDEYSDNFLLVIGFGNIFYAEVLEPNKADIIVTWEFVEDLCDSIREREESLALFIEEVKALDKTFADDALKSQKSEDHSISVQIRRYPVFIEGVAGQLFKIIKEYFEEQQQQPLFALLSDNISPKEKLLFNGNGNQIADAFKQLIEANLIVSCTKAELETWIIDHFRYVSNSHVKSFTAGYLNGIISSDVKICKSPIITVSRNASEIVLAPVGRFKKTSE